MSLEQQLDKAYKSKVEGNLLKKVKQTGLAIYSNIVLNTPVDTGRARQNWNIDINVVDVKITQDTGSDPDIGKALVATAKCTLRDIIYISNNLPYIRRLNDGYSQQAPAGFVEGAIQVGKRQAEELN